MAHVRISDTLGVKKCSLEPCDDSMIYDWVLRIGDFVEVLLCQKHLPLLRAALETRRYKYIETLSTEGGGNG